MPKVSKESASQSEHVDGIVDERSEELDGYTVAFDSFLGDMDGAPILKGAPNDQCQCPHWGYVFKGKMTFRFADREETYEAGDAFYAPPGHTPVIYKDAEVLMFQPTDELRLLRARGLKARRLDVGFPEWRRAGLPVELT